MSTIRTNKEGGDSMSLDVKMVVTVHLLFEENWEGTLEPPKCQVPKPEGKRETQW